MDIIVCVKQIPDPETPAAAFKVDAANNKVIPAQGVAPVISPFDAQAVEAALRIRDAQGSGKITVLSMGPASARDAIKHGLAMGADEGVLVSDPALDDADAYVTARVLAAAIQKIGGYQLILTGRQAADWDQGIVPSGIAEILGLPSVTVAKSVTATDGKVTVERVLQDGFETVEATLPAVVTISNELGDPRYPQLRQIMMAARKQVTTYTPADLGLSSADLQPRLKLEKLFVPVNTSQVEIIEGDTPAEQAANLARKLREAKLI
ncbi:MAG TPA: electron transfer flavoprotein subunit beta/FixA family protein [Dehalococcoidia bacterium]|nr:electron transfer flavoprotein subunit beta/FixA family protein [Dehalococcoidia bacterium]